ncbi:SMEK domain-containing protein [Galbibacter sp. EGI 63066]|uniref:ABC-three component system protein n=1 Tax=Galbibacter sp. EGI 63066 TaxID=2993559 RepID=UPI002248B386|nr:ABC-three component system protein [Galbibacter sp. EGI 63066]MCX2679575.1 SMEK domain-containing protein [Galbibacter sp. EGI 63066]
MNRSKYFEYIDEKIHTLAHRIQTKGKLNILNLHLHSENFYLHFFNLLYGYELINLNSSAQNVEAIDLIDHKNKIIFQVSATCTKQKIESTLSKDIFKKYKDYNFKFISISIDATDLRTKTFSNPHSVSFDPKNDIFDIKTILNYILTKNIKSQRELYEFIKDELGGEVDIIKLDSNLATIINILSLEKWDDSHIDDNSNSFEIERKIQFNELDDAREVIEEFCIYYKKVDEKYTEFDLLGANKSNSVLNSIKKEYRKLKKTDNKDDIFFNTIENIKNKVLISSNLNNIPIDEIELCIDILVVDAFIRCKIFENPKDYKYATT